MSERTLFHIFVNSYYWLTLARGLSRALSRDPASRSATHVYGVVIRSGASASTGRVVELRGADSKSPKNNLGCS
jgi:hypothetical protein